MKKAILVGFIFSAMVVIFPHLFEEGFKNEAMLNDEQTFFLLWPLTSILIKCLDNIKKKNTSDDNCN